MDLVTFIRIVAATVAVVLLAWVVLRRKSHA